MAKKHENDKFWVISLQHVSGLKVVVNSPGTPKLWAITHENGPKTQKMTSFWINISMTYQDLRAMQISTEPQNCGK